MKNKQKQLKINEIGLCFRDFKTYYPIIPKDILNDEAKNGLNKVKEIEKTVDRENLIYRASEYIYIVLRTTRSKGKTKIEDIVKNLYPFFDGRERVLDAFESKICPIKTKDTGFLNFDHSKLKIVTPKQMLQRFPISLAQVKVGTNSKNLLNEIRQVAYSLYQSKNY